MEILKLLKKHKRKLLTLLASALWVAGVLVIWTIFPDERYGDLELLCYSMQIVSGIYIIIGVIITVWQYYLTSKSEIIKLEKERVDKAIELAEYYKNKILKPYLPLYYVYKKSGIIDVIDTITGDMECFDQEELNMILGKDNIAKIKELSISDGFIKAVMYANKIYNLNINLESFLIKEKIDVNSLLNSFMNNVAVEVMNNLEIFSMHFTHNSADDTVVYQSLHQTYLQIVRMLYYNISKNNTDGVTDYYTNVISLYKKWSDIQKEVRKKATNERNGRRLCGTVSKDLQKIH